MTIHSADGDTVFVNFREKAPAAATPEMWQLDAEGNVIGNQKSIGGKSVGIPGNVRGMEYAFENYGSGNVTWQDVLAPAIDLAENGFLVTPTLYNDMFGSYDAMMAYPEFGDVYLNEDGLNYQVGDTFKNPDLAKMCIRDRLCTMRTEPYPEPQTRDVTEKPLDIKKHK